MTVFSYSSYNGFSSREKFDLSWLPQNDISRRMLVCVVVFLFTFLWYSGDSYMLKQKAKLMTLQAASVSLNVFIVLRLQRNEILRNNIESSREKYVTRYYFKAEISGKYIQSPGIDLD